MHFKTHIIEGGGWRLTRAAVKPKARLFGILTLVSLAPAVLSVSAGVSGSSPVLAALRTALLVPGPLFAGLALVFWLTETRRQVESWRSTPEHDTHKLF